MEDRVLFISSHPDVIEEFTSAYASEDFQVEVAHSGVEGVRKIAAATYKVVVTNLRLPDIDGIKIVQYLNKTLPNTVCIVYTTKLNTGQAAFLINKMHVFKVFLRPADYSGEMLDAIQQAFEKYNVVEADEGDVKEAVDYEEEQRVRYRELVAAIIDKNDAQSLIKSCAEAIFEATTSFNTKLTEGERLKLLALENKIISKALKESEKTIPDLMSLEVVLRGNFFDNAQGRSYKMEVESNVVKLPGDFILKLYLCLCFVIEYVNMFSKEYEMDINVEFETSTRITVTAVFKFPKEAYRSENANAFEEAARLMYDGLIKANCTELDTMFVPNEMSFKMSLDAGAEAIFERRN
ncbi:MAG: response regulator [Lachnospiraceae bacterium]|nr:response regulator [Lachnospiraceae bacterium]